MRGRREALRPHVLSGVTGADVTLKAKVAIGATRAQVTRSVLWRDASCGLEDTGHLSPDTGEGSVGCVGGA